jgi:hypothetical protein
MTTTADHMLTDSDRPGDGPIVRAAGRHPQSSLRDSLIALRSERTRRRIVGLVFVIYGLLIFEGSLRKWVLPQLQQIFFFSRIPFVLFLYGLVLSRGRWPRSNVPLAAAYVLAMIAACIIPIQMLVGRYSLAYGLLAGYGWTMYFLYIPIVFVIGDNFRKPDIDRLIRFTFYVAILSAPLVVAQFNSSPGAIINSGSSDDDQNKFNGLASALGHIRPSGFFTSVAGQGMFVPATITMVLAVWLRDRRDVPMSTVMLLIATGATVVMLMMSGSRSTFGRAAVVILAAASVPMLIPRKRLIVRALVWPTLLIIGLLVVWPIFFPEAYDAFTTRLADADANESQTFKAGFVGRLFFQFYAFTYYFEGTSPVGYILGLATDAGYTLSWVTRPRAEAVWSGYGNWGEDPWAKHIIELGPLVGVLYILFRIYMTYWLTRTAIRATRKTGDPLPMLLLGFAGLAILISIMTSQGAINGFTWLFAGFCLASSRVALNSAKPAAH